MGLELIKKTILKKVKGVKSIVLYGSRARGDFGPASDYDLLVISDMIPDTFDERLDLESKIGDELMLRGTQVSIIFMTPKELAYSISCPDPLMIEIYHNHKVLVDDGTFKNAIKKIEPKLKNAVQSKFIQSLIREAKVDLDSAKILFNAGKYARTIFFCQQALEKTAKAILFKKGHGVIISHDVSTLLATEVLPKHENEDLKDAILFLAGLERMFSRTRYPISFKGKIVEPSKEFTKDIAEKMLARTVKAFNVLKKVLKIV